MPTVDARRPKGGWADRLLDPQLARPMEFKRFPAGIMLQGHVDAAIVGYCYTYGCESLRPLNIARDDLTRPCEDESSFLQSFVHAASPKYDRHVPSCSLAEIQRVFQCGLILRISQLALHHPQYLP